MALVDDVRGFGRYARGLREFLSRPLPEPEARRMISSNLALREQSFLTLLADGVFKNSRSPYRRLFAHAGIELGDVAGMVRADGLEKTLAVLHDAGVRLTLAEAKGKQPVRRGDWEIGINPRDLHNPRITRHFEGSTGGSRSAGTRFWVDLGDVLRTSAYPVLARHGFGLERADGALWLPAPPAVAAMRRALWWSKSGMDIRRWFAQSVPRWRAAEIKQAAFVRWTLLSSRRAGRALPAPEHTPPAQARRVARWLSEAVRAGSPAVLFATPSSGVRVCAAAAEAGLDIAGTFFSFGGEPYTEAKARAIRLAGCRAESSLYISELGGPIAVGCANATAVDQAHLVEDRIAVIDTAQRLVDGGWIRPLHVTTISPLTPQVAINLETGDYAAHGRASCGCPFAQVGLSHTVHTIRSYEKLTTEGMHFVGPELLALLEDVLPRRFGGGPTDYQLIEQEDARGRSQISLVVAPRVGSLDESRVAEAALDFLRSRGVAERMMAEIWSSGGALRVVRREPEVSRAGKVLSLHVSRGMPQVHRR